MTNSFGPWTTAMHAEVDPQLSTFWKRRLNGLPLLAIEVSPGFGWVLAPVVGLGLAACVLPTLWVIAAPIEATAPMAALTGADRGDANAEPPVAVEPVVADPDRKIRLGAIGKAVTHLKQSQRENGSWSSRDNSFPIGVASLCTLSLLHAGVKPDDAVIQKALAFLRKQEPGMTYEVALQTLAFCAAEPKKDLLLIHRNASELVRGQIPNGDDAGSWGYYTERRGSVNRGDRSNGKFAIWALDEAARAGADVPEVVWQRAYDHWKGAQYADGSWGYTGQAGGGSSGSMTCSGIVSFAICSMRVAAANRVHPKADDIQVLERAVDWLGRNFAVAKNPGGNHWLLYYLMTLRQAGHVTGREQFAEHDWYREGSEFLVRSQRADGAWSGVGSMENDEMVAAAMALLFLQTGDRNK
jgi:hypothetical protein